MIQKKLEQKRFLKTTTDETMGDFIRKSKQENNWKKRQFISEAVEEKILEKQKLSDYSYSLIKDILHAYWSERVNKWDTLSPYCYTSRMKFFLNSEVRNHYELANHTKLMESIISLKCNNVPIPNKWTEDIDYDERDLIKDFIQEWKSGIIMSPIPVGISIADDIRILQNMDYINNNSNPKENTLIIVFTNDFDLATKTIKYFTKENSK